MGPIQWIENIHEPLIIKNRPLAFWKLFLLLAANSWVTKEECLQTGECKESFYFARDIAADEFDCLNFCKLEAKCAWFTFYPGTPVEANTFFKLSKFNFWMFHQIIVELSVSGICHLYRDCILLGDEYCPDCLSGQQECITGTKIMFLTTLKFIKELDSHLLSFLNSNYYKNSTKFP